MKTTLLILTSLLLSFPCLGQSHVRIFAHYDFNQGGYTLLMRPQTTTNNDFNYRPYYFKDIATLNRIKAQYILREKKIYPHIRSFPTATLMICLDGKVLESVLMYTDINVLEMASTGKLYEFDGWFPMQGYEFSEYKYLKFTNLQQARAAYDSIAAAPGLICLMPAPWVELEGYFRFNCGGVKEDKETWKKHLEDSLSQRYPGEPFYLVLTLHSVDRIRGNRYEATLHCRKSLSDRFDLYTRKDEPWTPYPLELATYWEKGK